MVLAPVPIPRSCCRAGLLKDACGTATAIPAQQNFRPARPPYQFTATPDRRFNAHLRQISFLFGDECDAPDDKGAEGQLKRLITEPTLQIEPKGRDPVEEPNRLHVMLDSNADWVVPAGAFERRYMVQLSAGPKLAQPDLQAAAIGRLRGDAVRLARLRSRGLARDTVRTDALSAQQEQSLSPFDAWWLELLQTAVLTGASESAPDRAVSNRY